MTTTMDIAVCLDCSSSIAFYSKQIRSIILSILRKALRCHQSDVRMALVKFLSHLDYWKPPTHKFTSSIDERKPPTHKFTSSIDEWKPPTDPSSSSIDEWITHINPFTSSIDEFQEWINDVQAQGRHFDDSKAIVDALDACLKLNWRPNNNPKRYHEKLVILITDGPPCNLLNDECPCHSKDLWQIADEFVKQDITLVVVGIEPSIIVCDDFYCALANKTGGEYLPLINASRVLSSVIPRAILEEDTLSQAFRHLDMCFDIEYNSLYRYSYVQKRARFMIEYCRTLADIRKLLFTYRHQPTGCAIDTVNIVNDDSEPSSPSNTNYLTYLSGPNVNIITSTPITDDEGYRTRLPTTASPDSSFIHIIGSPVLSHPMDLDWSSGIDDDCF